jgi:pimeloyl-ACP methyl ester carboxylesterase
VELGTFKGIPYVLSRGTGDPIVVLHGGQSFMRRFDRAAALRDARQVLRVLPPNRTTWLLGYDVTRDGDAMDHASAVAEFISANIGTPVVLMGVSFGGFIATCVALASPQLISKLILLSTARRFSDEGRRRMVDQIEALERGDLYAMARPYTNLFRRPWWNAVARFGLWRSRSALPQQMNEPATIVRMLRVALRASDAPVALDEVKVPTLLVAGSADHFFDRATLEESESQLPQGKLVLLDRETHTVALERSKAVAAAIQQFLA